MRVVVAPDKFAGSLSAVDAAEAIAAGWRSVAPDDDLLLLPMSDGGPGFVDALHSAIGGEVHDLVVAGPLGTPTPARMLSAERTTHSGDRTAYVEAAQAGGLHLVSASPVTVRTADTFGVGELLAAAARLRPERVVVGVGGTASNDGGSGAIRALGWRLLDGAREDLRAGGGQALLAAASLEPLPLAWADASGLVVATDVDNPLLGPNGASAVFGPQKGADRAAVLDLDDALRVWAEVAERAAGRRCRRGTGVRIDGARSVPDLRVRARRRRGGPRRRAAGC
jgi:glycerate 2-kinase